MTGDWTVRTVKDFDWKIPIKMLVKEGKTPGKLVEVQYENRAYYKAVGAAILGPGACFFYFPDARTVVLSLHEDHLRRRIQQGASQRLSSSGATTGNRSTERWSPLQLTIGKGG